MSDDYYNLNHMHGKHRSGGWIRKRWIITGSHIFPPFLTYLFAWI